MELPEGDIEEDHLNYPQDSEKDPPQTPPKKSNRKKQTSKLVRDPDSDPSSESDRDSSPLSPSPHQNRRSKTPHQMEWEQLTGLVSQSILPQVSRKNKTKIKEPEHCNRKGKFLDLMVFDKWAARVQKWIE